MSLNQEIFNRLIEILENIDKAQEDSNDVAEDQSCKGTDDPDVKCSETYASINGYNLSEFTPEQLANYVVNSIYQLKELKESTQRLNKQVNINNQACKDIHLDLDTISSTLGIDAISVNKNLCDAESWMSPGLYDSYRFEYILSILTESMAIKFS